MGGGRWVGGLFLCFVLFLLLLFCSVLGVPLF